MKTKHSSEPNQKTTHEAESSDYGLMALQEDPKEDEWLSHQFRRSPFRLYKYWLILNLTTVLIIEIYLICYWFGRSFEDGYISPDTLPAIGFVFFLYGCGKMLYAINKKKSRVAQEGFVQFQYALCSSVIFLISAKQQLEDLSAFDWLFLFEIVLSPVINLLGGFAVLQMFKKNHPLTRPNALQVPEETGQDFLEQNEMIASEFSKYDEQLNRWPYLIYKWVLKMSVASELAFFFQYILPYLSKLSQMSDLERKRAEIGFHMLPFLIGWGISSLLNAYSCFQMEIAMRTRHLVKSRRAIALLKICTVLSIIRGPFVGECPKFAGLFYLEDLHWYLRFAYSLLVPVFSLLGALKVKKIIEERESFVQVSSYSEDTYI